METPVASMPEHARDLEPLRRAAVDWIAGAGPRVEAVVLYGSWARGDANARSDVDMAVLARDEDAGIDTGDLRAVPNVECLVLTSERVRQRAESLGTVESALGIEGILLAGAWNRPKIEELRMDVERYGGFLENAVKRAEIGLSLAGEALQNRRAHENDAAAMSANAAESAAKAAFLERATEHPRGHKLEELAGILEKNRPGDPWAERMRRLNGDTHKLHLAGYADPGSPLEELSRTLERLVESLSFATDIFGETWRRRPEERTSLRARARRIRELFEEGARRPAFAFLPEEVRAAHERVAQDWTGLPEQARPE